jgi:hypothetical protein
MTPELLMCVPKYFHPGAWVTATSAVGAYLRRRAKLLTQGRVHIGVSPRSMKREPWTRCGFTI